MGCCTTVQERSGADAVWGHHDERFFWCRISRPVLLEKLWEGKSGESLILGAYFAWIYDVKSCPCWEYIFRLP